MKRWTVLAVAAVLAGPAGLAAQDTETTTTYEVRTSPGQVSLEAQPEWRDGRLVVSLSANTHSVDLSTIELRESVRLVVGDLEYAPGESASLAGHHARAVLTFKVPWQPDAFTLRIRGVPDVPERVLQWPGT